MEETTPDFPMSFPSYQSLTSLPSASCTVQRCSAPARGVLTSHPQRTMSAFQTRQPALTVVQSRSRSRSRNRNIGIGTGRESQLRVMEPSSCSNCKTGNTLAKWQTWAQNPKHEIRRTQILQAKQIQNQNDQKQFVLEYPCKPGLSRHRFEHLNF
jgi:hypothetical protein